MQTGKSLGQIAFEAYNEKGGWKTWDGKPVPQWGEGEGCIGIETMEKWESGASASAESALVSGSFSWALTAAKKGYRIARSGWNGKGMWVACQFPDEHSKMTLPYLYMKTADNQLVPWLISQTDALATDWTVLNEPE